MRWLNYCTLGFQYSVGCWVCWTMITHHLMAYIWPVAQLVQDSATRGPCRLRDFIRRFVFGMADAAQNALARGSESEARVRREDLDQADGGGDGDDVLCITGL